jgi:translocator protein
VQDRDLTTVPVSRPGTDWLALLGFLAVAGAAGFVGNLLQGDDVGVRYLTFERPVWAPPQQAFGIVWPILYLLIGVAAWRVWRAAGSLRAATTPLGLWAAQLVINGIWPGVFFGVNAFGLAIPVIVALDVVVVATIMVFHRFDRVAAWMLAPYLAWLLYATALNAALWVMN